MAIQRPALVDKYFHENSRLPYGLTVGEIRKAISAAYDLLDGLNQYLVSRGYGRLEDLLLGNSFAGVLSEVLVKSISDCSVTMTRNLQIGGFPDLIPRGRYASDSVLRGKQGIEIKSSKQSGGWQGHNPEAGWIMIFRYVVDTEDIAGGRPRPTEFVEVLAARLGEDDWNFSGRRGGSRRTITASINRQGVAKLRANAVYRHPDYAVRVRNQPPSSSASKRGSV